MVGESGVEVVEGVVGKSVVEVVVGDGSGRCDDGYRCGEVWNGGGSGDGVLQVGVWKGGRYRATWWTSSKQLKDTRSMTLSWIRIAPRQWYTRILLPPHTTLQGRQSRFAVLMVMPPATHLPTSIWT